MSHVHLVRVATFEPFLSYLAEGGCDVPRHLDRVGIPRDLLEEQENLVPLRRVCEFLENVANREQIDGFGIQVGSQSCMLEFGIFGEVIRRSMSLRDLLYRLERWVPMLDSGASAWLDRSDHPDAIRFCISQDTDVGCGIVDGFNLVLLINAIRLAAGNDWRPKRVWLTSAAATSPQLVEQLSDSQIEAEQDHTAIEIPTHLLPLPVDSKAETGRAGHPEEKLSASAPPCSLSDSIYTAVRSSFGASVPSITRMAEMADTSVRTLQRHLSREALDFSEIVDRARFDEACLLLQSGEKNISEISWHLGYSDPAHLTHAFRRWTGVSPSAYLSRRDLSAN